ncbi:MAG: hypothetical protein DWQ31_00030 [Planctomycetota bacterium]|nr:MAG: hypothetical protein DWQ31_00030 [Planctomycetota bacterium]
MRQRQPHVFQRPLSECLGRVGNGGDRCGGRLAIGHPALHQGQLAQRIGGRESGPLNQNRCDDRGRWCAATGNAATKEEI